MNSWKKLLMIVLTIVLVLPLVLLSGCSLLTTTSTPLSPAQDAFNRGTDLLNEGKYEEAIAECDKAIKLDPKYAKAYVNRGNAYYYEKHYDLATADYNKAIELDPKFAMAYVNRGSVYYVQKQYDLAIADYNKAIALDPKDAQAYYNRGVAYSYKGHNDLAIADYYMILQLKADTDLTQKANEKLANLGISSAAAQASIQASEYNQQGVTLCSQGKNDEAIAEFSKAIQVYANYPSAYTNRGIVYIKEKQYSTAIKDFSDAILINPNYALAYSNRALAFIYTENYDEAVADLDKSLVIDPEDSNAWNNRGVALEQLGESDAAEESYDTAIKLDPGNENAKNNGKVIQVGGRPPGISTNAWCSHYPPRIQEAWTGETPSEDLSLAAAAAQAVPQGGVGITDGSLAGEWINDSHFYGYIVSDGFQTVSYDVVLKLVVQSANNIGGLHEERPDTFTGTIQKTLRGYDLGDGVNLNSDYAQVQASGRADIGETSTSPVSGTVSGRYVILYMGNDTFHLTLNGDHLSGDTTLFHYHGIITDVKPSTEGYITYTYRFSLMRR